MPGRTSTRKSTASRFPHNASTQTFGPRKPTIIPSSVVPEEGPTSTLRTQICNVFSDAQRSIFGHRKLLVGLRKIQEACYYEPILPDKPNRTAFNENDFNMEITRCVIRLLGVKRSEVIGDRMIRFLGAFLRHATEKGREFLVRGRHYRTNTKALQMLH